MLVVNANDRKMCILVRLLMSEAGKLMQVSLFSVLTYNKKKRKNYSHPPASSDLKSVVPSDGESKTRM